MNPAYTMLLIILGHFVGDFIAQPKVMALRKSEPTWVGWAYCTWHVMLYSTFVSLFAVGTLWFPPTVFAAIAVPHWIIDRYSLADKWLHFIEGRTFTAAFNSTDKYREFDVAFTAIVYTVVDSTFHVICLWMMAVYCGLL